MSSEVEVKKTTNLETSIHGLAFFGNYSLRVAAHTAVGDGVRSGPIFCTTDEDGKYKKYTYLNTKTLVRLL